MLRKINFLVFFIQSVTMLTASMYSKSGIHFLFFFLSLLPTISAKQKLDLVWPTPSYQKFKTQNLAEWAQATRSGKLISAQFGCTRNDGTRFHEAIDIKPYYNRRNGEATDPIFAIMNGRVAHISKTSGNSGYGRYVVIVHEDENPAVYSLYAHLAKVEPQLKIGQKVNAGYRIGTMGRSAGGYSIPKANAHLHLEIGVRLGANFQKWYDKQGFGSKNHHGNFNGLNLVGFDPERFYNSYEQNKMLNISDYIKNLKTSYTVRIGSKDIPDFVQRYPELLTQTPQKNTLVGWEIDFTWYGLPKQWTPIHHSNKTYLKNGSVSLLRYDPKSLKEAKVRKTLRTKGGHPSLGKSGINYIKLLFNFQ